MRLTDISIRSLKPPEKGAVIYTDDTVRGFGVRVSQGGKKVFVLTYGKNRKRLKIGEVGIVSLKDARQKAKNILSEHQLSGGNAEAATTFDDAFSRFMEGYADKNKPSTVSETERLLKRYLEPLYKGRMLAEVSKSAMVETLDCIESKSERRHFYTAAHTFFRWCRRYDLKNPLEGVQKPSKSTSRARLLSDDEFLSIWRSSLSCGVYGLIYRNLLVSGQRVNQLATLDSAFLDRGQRLIIWPTHLMKTNREFIFPFGELLNSLLPQHDGFLFSNEGKPFNNWSTAHKQLLKLTGIPHFTRHDCRRFYSSTHSAIGTPPHIRELLLSHAIGSEVSQIYDRHSYLDEKRTAQEAYEQHLSRLIEKA